MAKNSTKSANPEANAALDGDSHVDPDLLKDVKKQGDVFDELRGQTEHFAAHYAIRAGALTSGLATGLMGSWDYLAPRHFAYGAVAAGAAEANRRFRNRRAGKRIDAILSANNSMAVATGEPLELIRQNARRKKDRAVQMYWGVEFDEDAAPDEVRARLESVAEFAQASGLDTVVIPDDVAYFIDESTDREQYLSKTLKVSDWLKDTKRRASVDQWHQDEDGSKKRILKLTPAECLELAEHIEQLDQDPKTFAYAWEVLRQARPTHVMFRQYASRYEHLANLSKRNGIHNQARQTLANHIALALDDTTVSRGPNHERVRVNMRGSIDARHPIVRLQGAQAVDSANGQEAVHAEDTGALLSHLGLEPIDLRIFFENPGKLSEKKRIQAAEIVLLYELAGWSLPYTPDSNLEVSGRDISSDASAELPASLQQSAAIRLGVTNKTMRKRLSERDYDAAARVNLDRLMPKRFVRLGAALLLALALSSDMGSEAVNAPANYLYHRSEAQYIQDLPKRDLEDMLEQISKNEDTYSQLDRKRLEELIKEAQESGEVPSDLYDDFRREQPMDPYNWLISNGFDLDRKIRDSISGFSGVPGVGDEFGNEGQAGADSDRAQENTNSMDEQDSAGVGNVSTEGGNKPLWKLDSNGMDTAGYWTQSTHRQVLEAEGGGLYWEPVYEHDTKTKTIPTLDPKEVEQSDKWIRVSSVDPVQLNKIYIYSDKSVMSVPVLNGTVPVAAVIHTGEYGSNQTTAHAGKILQRDDGTFMVIANEDPYGPNSGGKTFIDYWLAPADTRPEMPFGLPHAEKPTTGSLYSFGKEEPDDFGLADADDEVNKYVLGLPKGGDLKRTEALAQYMRSNFTYALAPFKADKDGNTVDEDIESIPDYIDLVFKGKKANCNVANTALIVDNPSQLNAVTGYRNNPDANSPYDTLSKADGHMWAVDKDGNEHDATPGGGLSAKDAAYFEENFTAKDFEKPKSSADEWEKRFEVAKKIAAGAMIGLAAAYAIRKRKQLAEAARNVKQTAVNTRGKIAEKRLNRIITTRPQAVRVATEVLEHAVFHNRPEDKKAVTPFNTVTPQGNESVRRTLRITSSQGSAKAKVVAADQSGAFDKREVSAVKLAQKLLKLSDYADQQVTT